MDTALPASSVASLWITIIRYVGSEVDKFFSWPMLKGDSTTNVYLDMARNSGALPFIPIAGDSFSVGLAPAKLTFPWDVMDAVWVDKQIMGAYFWLDQDFHARTALDWTEAYTPYFSLSSTGGKRRLFAFAPSKHCEALKLDLVSFKKKARLDAYAYQVHYKGEGVTKQ